MVHTFFNLDNYFALDVESGSFFLIDELTHLLLKQRMGQACDFTKFTKEQIAEANSEIDHLIESGVLFTSFEAPQIKNQHAPIKSMCLNICHDCNLNCSYCFAGDGVSQRQTMDYETAQRAVDFLIEKSQNRKALEIDFFGGEPLLNLEVVKKTVEYAREQARLHGKSFRFTLTTNAMLLDEETAHYLNENMDNVVLSIDGRQAVHNQMRKTASGQASYQTVLNNSLKFAKIRGDREYYVRGTYTVKNLDFDEDVLSLREAGFDQISIEPVVLASNHELAIKHEHLASIDESYQRLARHWLKARRNEDTWYNFFHFMLDFDNAPCQKKLISACGAGSSYIAVAPDGNIYPCHQFAGGLDQIIGNVHSGEFDLKKSECFLGCNITTKPTCDSCWAKYYCGGGCFANNLHFGGGLQNCYELGCEIMKIRLKTALSVNALEKV